MMPPPPGSVGFLFCPSGTKTCVLLLAFGLSAYLLAPPLYWHFVEGFSASKHLRSCPPCICDCPSENASSQLPAGVGNNSADCTNLDPRIREEMVKSSVELLTEELKLQAVVTEETQQRADASLLEAKKLSSQYQKEAEKCNLGMETCEEAREKAEEALLVQMKMSAKWEQRARDLGWRNDENPEKDFH